MRRSIWLATIAGVVALAVVAGIVLVGYTHRGHLIADRNRALARSRAALASDARFSAALRHQLASGDQARQQTLRQLQRARRRLANPPRGPIPRHLSYLQRGLSSFVPRGTDLEQLKRVPALGGARREVAVAWQAHPPRDGSMPAAGFLLWQATPPQPVLANQPYRAPATWRVIYDWHTVRDGYRTYDGPPGHQHVERELGVLDFSFAAGDVTGDGHPDVLVSGYTGGSGACATWRVLSVVAGSATSILHRSTCDGGLALRDGLLDVRTSVYHPGCSIHGCGDFHRTMLRWTGSGWSVVSRAIVGKPFPPDEGGSPA
jgi:hypothetical protein